MSDITDSPDAAGAREPLHPLEPTVVSLVPPDGDGEEKTVLPRRPGESRFAPPQYYYSASRSGVVPSGTGRAA